MNTNKDSSTTILIIKSNLDHNQFNTLMALISSEKQDRIRRYRLISDAHNSLIGDVVVRAELCKATGLQNNQLRFSTNKYGKPFLINANEIHYNISHSDKFVVCAFSSDPIGVDVESVKPIDTAIADRFFSLDEIDYIGDSACGSENERFYKIWTMKESYIKWNGMGLSKKLNSFSVLKTLSNFPPHYHLVHKDNEAICHACTTIKQKPEVKYIQIEELLENLPP